MAKKKNDLEENKVETGEEEKESVGSKIGLVVIALFIILIWLAIIGVAIKADIGGFGSSVLYPLLKDVPYVNRILPEVEPQSPEEEAYKFATMDEAVERIKELELQLTEAENVNREQADSIASLQEQADELARYKEEEAEFELVKEKFYEEVVLSDSAPDINEYRTYYESIDPENAEILYRQVVEQTVYDEQLEDYVKTYSTMKPKAAAQIFDTMEDMNLIARILQNMDAQTRGDILSNMDSDKAAKLTQMMEPDSP